MLDYIIQQRRTSLWTKCVTRPSNRTGIEYVANSLTVMLSKLRCLAWPLAWMSAHNSRTFCRVLRSCTSDKPQSSSADVWLMSLSSKFSISSRQSRSKSILSWSWLSTNITVAVHIPRLCMIHYWMSKLSKLHYYFWRLLSINICIYIFACTQTMVCWFSSNLVHSSNFNILILISGHVWYLCINKVYLHTLINTFLSMWVTITKTFWCYESFILITINFTESRKRYCFNGKRLDQKQKI